MDASHEVSEYAERPLSSIAEERSPRSPYQHVNLPLNPATHHDAASPISELDDAHDRTLELSGSKKSQREAGRPSHGLAIKPANVTRVRVVQPPRSERESSQDPAQFAAIRRRLKTDLVSVEHEERPFPHKYVFRRPRALQATYEGHVFEGGDAGQFEPRVLESQNVSRTTSKSRGASNAEEREERTTDFINIQRERIDLFIDLLWIGIISNISEHYYNQAFSSPNNSRNAIVEFVLLFGPAWRIWSALQVFLSSYYMDDMIQRMIIMWVMVLGLVWGNNAPYILNTSDGVRTTSYADYSIVVYLVAINSLVFLELIYSIWIPWIRRMLFIGFLIKLPSTGLWIACTLVTDWLQIYLLAAAMIYDYVFIIFIRSPLASHILGSGLQKAENQSHTIKRYENFFIIALGEGVFLLIRGSPLGRGLTPELGRGALALLIYYCINWLYFNADQTKCFIHAHSRRWWIRTLWYLLHVPLYAAIVLLSSGVLYLVGYASGTEQYTEGSGTTTARRTLTPLLSRESEPATIDESVKTLRVAFLTVSIDLAVVLLLVTVIALLNRPLDQPKTLLVNNRFLRLAPRIASIPAVALMGLHHFASPTTYLGWLAVILAIVMAWEWHAGMERGGSLIEPRLMTLQESSENTSRGATQEKRNDAG